MGSSFNPVDAIKSATIGFIDNIINVTKQIIKGRLDKAIGEAIQGAVLGLLGIVFDDEYKEITNVDSKMYNLLGSNKPDSEILTSATRSVIYDMDMLQCIREDLFNGGFVRINSYVQWAKRNNIYSKIGFNTTALQNHISDHQVLAAIKTVLGDIDYYPNTGDIGTLQELRFQLGLAYCGKHDIELDTLVSCEIVSAVNQQAEVLLSDGSKIRFNLSEFGIRTDKEYAVCIYRTYEDVYTYIAEQASIDDLPFKEELGIFTKTFRYGETGFSTYSVEDACEEAGVARIFVESFTFEERTVIETIEPTEEELEENPDLEPREETHVERTYTLTYTQVDYDSPLFDDTQDEYYTFNPATGEVLHYTKVLISVPTSNWSSYWYEYNTGLPTIDNLWTEARKQTDTAYSFMPVLPVRTFTQPITKELFPNYYPILTKSCKKIFKDRKFFPTLVEKIDSNAQAKHIDFAHLLFAVPLNRKEEYSIEYICKFFIYISSYSRYFQTQAYADQFNPRIDYGEHVSLYNVNYQKRLGYWCSVPDSITAELDWSLYWDACHYDTFFAGSTPKKPYWIENSNISSGQYRLSGESANVGIVITATISRTRDSDGGYDTTVTFYASYVTNMTLDTSLFSADIMSKGRTDGADLFDSGVSDEKRTEYNAKRNNRTPLVRYSPWVSAGKLSTRNWHICSTTELNYLRSKYNLAVNPITYINSKLGTNLSGTQLTPSTYTISGRTYTLANTLGFNTSSKLFTKSNPSTAIISCTATKLVRSSSSSFSRYVVQKIPYYSCNVPFGSVGMNILEIPKNQAYFFNVLTDVNGITPLPSGKCLVFNRQISGTYCERAYVYNLNIKNSVLSNFSIVYSAHNYLNSTDTSNGTCPFVIPINLTVMKQMSMVHRNEVLQVSYNLLVNIFVRETVRVPWYATKDFRNFTIVARIVITVVISVFATPAGGSGFNAFYNAALAVGFNVATSLIISAIISRIVIAVVAMVVAKIVAKVTGNEWIGTIAGIAVAIIGSYMMSSYDANGKLISSESFSWDKLYTNISSKITEFLSSPKDLAELAISGANKYIAKLNQGVQEDYAELSNAYKQFQTTAQEETQKLYELEAYNNSFRNTNFASTLSTRMLQNPYQGAKLNTTLADSTAIYALSQSKVYNMYEITINVKNYV